MPKRLYGTACSMLAREDSMIWDFRGRRPLNYTSNEN